MRRDPVVIYIHRRARPTDRHISPPPRCSLVSRVLCTYTYQFLRLSVHCMYIHTVWAVYVYKIWNIIVAPDDGLMSEKRIAGAAHLARYARLRFSLHRHIRIIYNIIKMYTLQQSDTSRRPKSLSTRTEYNTPRRMKLMPSRISYHLHVVGFSLTSSSLQQTISHE